MSYNIEKDDSTVDCINYGIIYVEYYNIYDTDIYDPNIKDTRDDDNSKQYNLFIFPIKYKKIIIVYTEGSNHDLIKINKIDIENQLDPGDCENVNTESSIINSIEKQLLNLLLLELTYTDYKIKSYLSEDVLNIIVKWELRLGSNFTGEDYKSIEEAKRYSKEIMLKSKKRLNLDLYLLNYLIDQLEQHIGDTSFSSSSSVILSDDSLE